VLRPPSHPCSRADRQTTDPRLSIRYPLSAIRWLLLFCALYPVPCSLLQGCNRTSHPAQVGEHAPAIVIRDGAQTVSLRQYQSQDKIVVLNFWASWCPPCLEEFPSLIDLQRRMPNIVVLAVSFDTDANAYRQYVVDNHIAGIVTILDLSQRSNTAFDTTRPPETYIIDRNGIIRRKFIGAQDWTTPEIINYLQNL
jgi:cytochrome c biogenesis protein CcmG, thiol:disulfide interchange protein DsbE